MLPKSQEEFEDTKGR